MAASENSHKPIILSLIKDDIVNTNLISGLRELGIDSGDYLLHIPEAILQLMGFEDGPDTDEIYDAYFDLIQHITPKSPNELRAIADENAEMIYKVLLAFKNPLPKR